MKNLIRTLTLAAVILMITFSACKKSSNDPKPEPKPITAEELTGYQLLLLFSSPANNIPPKLFHFAKSGNEIMATLDGVQSRRIRAIQITDNRFTFDSDADGKFVYEFNLKRNENDLVVISESKYINLNDPSIKMLGGTIWQSDFPSVKGKSFTSFEGNNKLKFTDNTWTLTPLTNKTGTFYEIAKGAWKGNLNETDYMGFSTISDKGELIHILVKEGSKELVGFQ